MSAKPSGVAAVKTVHAAAIARVHTYLAFTAFLSALGIGCLLHYKKIVKNGVAGYPEEWCVLLYLVCFARMNNLMVDLA